MLQKEEILAEGIDINDENIEFCSRKGLKVTKSQAMSLYNFYMDILMEQLKQDFHSDSYMKSLEKEIFS